MPTMTSQVIKFADTQKSRYFENATLLFCKIKNKLLLHIKGYIMAKKHVDYVLDISVKLNGRDYKRVNSLLKINFFISVFNGL